MGTYKGNILIVDSETTVRQSLAKHFIDTGYKVFLSTNGAEALKITNREDINLVILDILLPKIDGYGVCRQIRKNLHIPIIILTALDSFNNRIMGLESGANDFLSKPVSLKELEIKVHYNLHYYNFQEFKKRPTQQEIFYFGSLIINLTKQQVFINNRQLLLTEIEFSLLQLLVQNAGRELSRAIILDNIWGYTPERDIDTRIVDVHISRLRSKLEKNPKNPDFILTARGTGYMFQNLNL